MKQCCIGSNILLVSSEFCSCSPGIAATHLWEAEESIKIASVALSSPTKGVEF
jgi:hypothetical protein